MRTGDAHHFEYAFVVSGDSQQVRRVRLPLILIPTAILVSLAAGFWLFRASRPPAAPPRVTARAKPTDAPMWTKPAPPWTTRTSGEPKLDASPLKEIEAQAVREPKGFDAQVRLGDAYYDLEQHEKAIAAYQRALTIRDTAYVRTNLGVSLHTLHRTDEALEHFARASEIDPSYWKASFNELVIFANRKQYEKAFARIEHLRSLQQTNSEIPPLDDLERHLRARAAQLR